jgi:hypothetical protein
VGKIWLMRSQYYEMKEPILPFKELPVSYYCHLIKNSGTILGSHEWHFEKLENFASTF